MKSELSYILPDEYKTFEEYIIKNENIGLEYIIVDEGDSRSKFLKDVFINEINYPYLEKIYDSRFDNYNYHVKIFKINYNKFFEVYNQDLTLKKVLNFNDKY